MKSQVFSLSSLEALIVSVLIKRGSASIPVFVSELVIFSLRGASGIISFEQALNCEPILDRMVEEGIIDCVRDTYFNIIRFHNELRINV